MLDVYWERAGADGRWAEPLNALTNPAFVAAAAVLVVRLQRTPRLGWHDRWDL